MLFPLSKTTGGSPVRVVVTGAGVVTSLGLGWKANAEGFRAGRAAMRPVTLFDVTRQRAKIAAEVDLPAVLPSTKLSTAEKRRIGRASWLLLLSAVEAWNQAGWTGGGPALPIVLGTTSGEMGLGQDYLRQALTPPHGRKNQAARVAYYLIQQQGVVLASALGVEASLTSISNACASGANAIGHAFEMIRSGAAQQVLTGGYDALCHLTFAGFDSLQVLSSHPGRPFDAARDGLTLGEGAAVLALESYDHARRRGAEILGEVLGYGASSDNHHLTQPHPEGGAALAAMKLACASAKLTPAEIDYVNAHGTATPQNDAAEAAAINAWAGDRAATLPVSSTKAGIGHLLGAAGAVEAAVCLMALRGQWLPPQINLQTPDPVCRFPLVRKAADAKLRTALSNSFGFGGANASLIFGRWS